MRISSLIIILTVIASINSYDFYLRNGITQSLGTLNSGQTYSFFLDAESGQTVNIELTTTSTNVGYPSFTVYSYIKDLSYYGAKNDFTFNVNGNTLSKEIELGYVKQNSENKLISYIVFEFTPLYTMSNSKVITTVTGTPFSQEVTALEIVSIIFIIILPYICCIACVFLIIYCCRKRSSYLSSTDYYQKPSEQPLYY